MAAPTNMLLVSQFMGRFTPADSAAVQLSCLMHLMAKCRVTKDEEHAVSMLTHGPCIENDPVNESRGLFGMLF